MLKFLKKIIPKPIFNFFQPAYHYLLALSGAIIYRFPSKKLVIVGVTGTKGKTTTVEIVNNILESAGYKTALQSTLHFKIADKDKRNLLKMTTPGRFFMHKFLRDAVNAGCSHVVLEMSSEGAKQFRHKFIWPSALIFTNLAPEHIESHGSYQNYLNAKLSIARELTKNSSKDFFLNPAIIANIDDKEGQKFLDLNIENKIPYSLHDAFAVKADETGSSFQIGKLVIHSKLPGIFNVYNMLGAIAYAKFAGIPDEKIKKGIEKLNFVRGRMEKIENNLGIDIVVDYAHTPDSLESVYKTYAPRLTKSAPKSLSSSQKQKKNSPNNKYYLVCVLGNTGGGRDTWKRKVMGEIANKYCDQIILTNEDPYDEDPLKIIEDVKEGIKSRPTEIIIDRREAINKAIEIASNLTPKPPLLPPDSPSWRAGDKEKGQGDKINIAVLITGKGTDPYIMGPNGTKQEWDDASVVREELEKLK